MQLTLERKELTATYTMGKLLVNGVAVCDTLEDPVRDLNKNGIFDNGEKKEYGNTSIPYGTYEIKLVNSSHIFNLKVIRPVVGSYGLKRAKWNKSVKT